MTEDEIECQQCGHVTSWEALEGSGDDGRCPRCGGGEFVAVSEPPIEETADRGVGAPMTLIVPRDAADDDVRRFIARLEARGYGTYKEYSNEAQAVYTVDPTAPEED